MPKELIKFRVKIADADVFIKTDSNKAASNALESILRNRLKVEKYALKNPIFLKALGPIQITSDSPEVIKRMAYAAESANVGPMAAVAGAISDLAVEKMIEDGAKIAIVENGGEISAISKREFNIAINTGSPSFSEGFGLKIPPEDTPIGIGTSSATVGPSFSLGDADAATVVADNAALGDAVSTSLCNEVKTKDLKTSIKNGLELAKRIEGVRGSIIIKDNVVGLAGKLPQMISIE
ncbi:MAG: UPF0280 family protein [Candidatus Bathyarchaeota archaeon]|nr:UPF0280 family protein [Candidatus Bathyarchaeota archaeon]